MAENAPAEVIPLHRFQTDDNDFGWRWLECTMTQVGMWL